MIWLIFAISIVLRLITINQSVWLDEGINVNVASALNLKHLILNYTLGDFHPPLWHIILYFWIKLFGTSEISVRIPSVIFGVLTVGTTYLISKSLFGKKTALISAILMATAPLAIYYSQEARMYSLAAFAASLSVYFYILLLKKYNFKNWLGFIFATTIMLYSDYLPYLMIPVYGAYLIMMRKNITKHTLKSFILAFFLIFIIIIPWLIVFQHQFRDGLSLATAIPTWAQVVGTPNIKNLLLVFVKFTIGRISSTNNLLYATLFAPVAGFIIFLFSLSLFRVSKKQLFLWLWFLLPVFFAFIISYFVPIFAYFRFIFVLPAFYIIIASSINTIRWKPLVRTLSVIALTINLTSITIYFTNSQFQRENWKAATAYVVANSTIKTVTLFEHTFTIGPFDYYNMPYKSKGVWENLFVKYIPDAKTGDAIQAFGALDSLTPDREKVHNNVAKYTYDKNKVFLFSYLSPITDPQGFVYKELYNQGFINVATKDFEGVGLVYEFKR